ncbi:MAG: DUF4145 domain-containing protein [Gemmataceae bacterium]|nr:DUF4145 domain-containing protein [Gemmataceae bacterium]MCI0739425.1 DUF4145 domain-containing protein [Gemmataceae bacterium]
MQCPHCLQHFRSAPKEVDFRDWGYPKFAVTIETCANCSDPIVYFLQENAVGERQAELLYPKEPARPVVWQDVPDELYEDYREANQLLQHSPKASAALSRKCLRNLIHSVYGIRATDFGKEIETLAATKLLPKYLANSLNEVRIIGDFAAFPFKSTNPGEIQDVEPNEAEWLLSTLEGLFAHCFVLPAEMQRKRAALGAAMGLVG